jgi:large subunit ribosomal protein L9
MSTDVILLERVENLGQMGEVVNVKPGHARNYLLPQKKALRATRDNIAYFEAQRKKLEELNEKKKDEARQRADKVEKMNLRLIRQAAENGTLYGSVSARDIADEIAEQGVRLERSQVELKDALKSIGLYSVTIALHPEVKIEQTVNIARTQDEADVQAKTGRAVIADSSQASTAEAAEEMLAEALEEAEEAAEEYKEEFLEEEALEAEAEAETEAEETAQQEDGETAEAAEGSDSKSEAEEQKS